METQTNTDANPEAKRGRGRPKTFDRTGALEQAMRLFWDRGYEGTTFDHLIQAMGISPSSFYNSFGSKERLFQEATDLYMARSSAWLMSELNAETDAKTAVHRLLSRSAQQYTQQDCPTGCMVSLSCTSVPPALESLRDLMARLRRVAQQATEDRLALAVAGGELPRGTDIAALAGFYTAQLRGMAVLARDGATGDELQRIADFAMRAWP